MALIRAVVDEGGDAVADAVTERGEVVHDDEVVEGLASGAVA